MFSFFGFGKKKKDKEGKEAKSASLVRVQPRRNNGVDAAPLSAGANVDSPAAAAPARHPGVSSERYTRSTAAQQHRSSASVSASAPQQQQQQQQKQKQPQRIQVQPAPGGTSSSSADVEFLSAGEHHDLVVEEADEDFTGEPAAAAPPPPKKKKNYPAPRKFTFSDWDITRATGHEYHRGIGFVS